VAELTDYMPIGTDGEQPNEIIRDGVRRAALPRDSFAPDSVSTWARSSTARVGMARQARGAGRSTDYADERNASLALDPTSHPNALKRSWSNTPTVPAM
jgi:hypothetical protein